MTIGTSTARIAFNCDGVTTVFPVSLQSYQSSDFTVLLTSAAGVITNLSLGGDYTLVASGTLTPPYWTLTTTLVYAVGNTLIIFENLPVVQQTQYVQGQAFPSAAVQTNLDRLTQMIQRVTDQVSRTVHAADGELIPGLLLPSPQSRALKFLSFDTNGNAVVTGALPSGTVTQVGIGVVLYPQTTAEIAASVAPTFIYYPPLDPLRYGVIANGVVNDTAAWTQWRSVVNQITTAGPFHSYGIRSDPTSFGGYPQNLKNLVVGDLANTAFGYNSQVLTSGSGGTPVLGNTSFGYLSLDANVTGQFSTAIGANNQHLSTGLGFNTTVGYGCGYNITIGTSNVMMGFEAGHDNQAGSANCIIGYSAQHYGLANGGAADPNNVTAIGTFALKFNRAANVVGIGYSSLQNNTGAGNTAVGYNTAVTNTSGSQSTFLGESAGANKSTGTYDTMLGFQAGLTQTTSAGFNTYVGGLAGFYNTTGLQNTYLGYQAGQGTNGINGGGGNTAVGNQAMGAYTVAVSSCTAIGELALRIIGANGNTAVGDSALTQETTGINNTAIGYLAGSTQTVGFNNTTNVGYQATSTASNQITLGNASIATIRAQVTTITALSDARYKKNMTPLALPDAFIDETQIISFEWDDPAMAHNGRQMGVVAQQLDALQDRYGLQWLKLVDKSDPNRLEATPGKLLFPAIVAIQKLRARVALLEAKT